MNYFLLYYLLGVCWASFGIWMQLKYVPKTVKKYQIWFFISSILDSLFWPIGFTLFIINIIKNYKNDTNI